MLGVAATTLGVWFAFAGSVVASSIAAVNALLTSKNAAASAAAQQTSAVAATSAAETSKLAVEQLQKSRERDVVQQRIQWGLGLMIHPDPNVRRQARSYLENIAKDPETGESDVDFILDSLRAFYEGKLQPPDV